MTQFKDRIKEIRKLKGKDLLANPKNWRLHPEHQLQGLRSALGSVGKVGALIAWESPDGLMLLDGHGRVELNPDEEWTVLILDIETQEEADKILMSYDSLGSLADINKVKFEALINFDADNYTGDILTSLSKSGLFNEVSFDGFNEDKSPVYTRKAEPPIYTPDCEKPSIDEMINVTKYTELMNEIEKAKLPEDIKTFLSYAATRHIVFRYDKIADYYAHSDKKIQELMENSALVIVDVNKAIEKGFVVLSSKFRELVSTLDDG